VACKGLLSTAILGSFLLLPRRDARAQESTALDRVEPAPAGDPFLVAPSAGVEGTLRPAFALLGTYALEPLRVRDEARERSRAVVEHQVGLHLLGSVALFDRVLVGIDAPFYVLQSGEPVTELPESVAYAPPPSAAVGDIRLTARAELLEADRGLPAVGLGASLALPSGDEAGYASTGSVRFTPRALLSGDYGFLLWSTSVARTFEPERTAQANLVGDQIEVDLAVAGRIAWAQLGVEAHLAAEVGAPAASTTPAIRFEPLASARAYVEPVVFAIAGGPGIWNAPGTPTFRLLFEVGVAFDLLPQGLDGGESEPRPEGAGDGRAPPGAEHTSTPSPSPGTGPRRDRDGDDVPDAFDACPDVRGVRQLALESNGCPLVQAAPPPDPGVVVQAGQIVIKEEIRFESGSAVLLPESSVPLEAVRRALAGDPTIARVGVDGHTDDRGDSRKNLELSRARALSVVRWLTDKGIDARRLEARGFGARQPLVENRDDAARAKNRRVEFIILRRDARGEPAWIDGTLPSEPEGKDRP
jgi:outer membrane protein OmpA-like peptidoglycan-associated protein